jgi:hypothetical protein
MSTHIQKYLYESGFDIDPISDVRVKFISDLKKGKYKNKAFKEVKKSRSEYGYEFQIYDKYLATIDLVKQFRAVDYSGNKPNGKNYFIGVNINEIGTQNNSYSQIKIGKVIDDNSYALDMKFDNFIREKLGFGHINYNNIEVFKI